MLDKKTSTKGKYDKSTLLSKKSGMSYPVKIIPPEDPGESEVINDEDSDQSISHLIKSQVHLPFERGWYIDGRSGESFFADLDVKNFRLVKAKTIAATDAGEPGEFAWDSNYIYVCVSDDTWKKVDLKTIPGTDEFTSGKILAAGNAVAVESDGKIYPTRVIEVSSEENADTTIDVGNTISANHPIRAFDCSATIKAAVTRDYQPASIDQVYVIRYVVDPADASFSSSSKTALTSSGVISEMYLWDAQLLDSTHIAIAWVDIVAGTTQLNTKVVDISSGVTQGSVVQIATGAGLSSSKIAISVQSSAEYFIWFQDASSGIKAQRCTVSGTTVTAGTSNTITSDTSDQVYGASVFEDSSHHLVIYEDDSAGYAVFQCGSNASGTLTMGSEVAAGSYSSGATTSLHTVITLDSTTCISLNAFNNVTWGLYERCITRSGTTLTIRAATGYVDDMDGGVQYPPAAVHLGNREVAVLFHCTPGLSDYNVCRVFYYPTTASPTLGSYWENTSADVGGPCGICRGTGKALFGMGMDTSGNGVIRACFMTCTNNLSGFIGIAEEAATAADQTISVRLYGKSSSMSGLTAGSKHYTQPSGLAQPTRTFGAERVGVAESATEMIIQP